MGLLSHRYTVRGPGWPRLHVGLHSGGAASGAVGRSSSCEQEAGHRCLPGPVERHDPVCFLHQSILAASPHQNRTGNIVRSAGTLTPC